MISFGIIHLLYTDSFTMASAHHQRKSNIAEIDTYTKSEGVDVAWGADLIRCLINDDRNRVVLASQCKLEGFQDDTRSEYKERSVVRTEQGGRIILTAPRFPKAYLAFLIYDGSSAERIGLYINNQLKAVAVANTNNNRNHIYTLEDPYWFEGGEQIVLQTGSDNGTHRIAKILFLHQKPLICEREYTITNVHTEPISVADSSNSVRITWITSWPTTTSIEYGETTDYGSIAETSLPALQNNHRVIVTGLTYEQTYHYRIMAKRPDGKSITTPDLIFQARPSAVKAGDIKKNNLPLQLTHSMSLQNWPVTSGIPFPKGEIASVKQIRVLNAFGQEIPSQIKTLSQWIDGSIKWILLDFQADVLANETIQYTLEYGTEVQPKIFASQLKVVDRGNEVEVDTGELQFTIYRNQSFTSLFQIELTDTDGTIYNALSPPHQVEIQEIGLLRAEIRINGVHRGKDGQELFTYTVEIHVYANKPYARVFYTFGNNHYKNEFTSIHSLNLKFPLSEMKQEGVYTFGNEIKDQVLSGKLTADGQTELHQVFDNVFTLGDVTGKRASGWLDISDGKRGVSVAVRHFWQQYPKSLAVDNRQITVGICPPIKADTYTGFDPQTQDKLYYYLQNGEYAFKLGVTKRHELFLLHHQGDLESADITAQVTAFQEPPLVVAPSSWYCRSGAFGDLTPTETSAYPKYDQMMKESLARYLQDREDSKEYGMLNFGDWYGERGYNWGNIEYDTQHALLVQYIRTGDRRFFAPAEWAVRHNMDIDTVHYHHQPFRVGAQYTHCMGHVGGYDWVGSTAIQQGGFSVSHSWVEGLLEYYCLTGDNCARETAQLITDLYNTRDLTNYDFTNCRVPGWHLIMTMAMFNATNDRYYLNAAKIIVDRVLERQTPDQPLVENGRLNGGWTRLMIPGHCKCDPPRHIGNAGFMVGILLAGLKAYHQVTGDELVKDSIIRAAYYLCRDVWEPKIVGFRYTSCPHSSKGTGNFRKLLGIAYAYRLTGNEDLGEVARKGVLAGIQNLSSSGKGLSAHSRFAPYVLHDLQIGDLEWRTNKWELRDLDY